MSVRGSAEERRMALSCRAAEIIASASAALRRQLNRSQGRMKWDLWIDTVCTNWTFGLNHVESHP